MFQFVHQIVSNFVSLQELISTHWNGNAHTNAVDRNCRVGKIFLQGPLFTVYTSIDKCHFKAAIINIWKHM